MSWAGQCFGPGVQCMVHVLHYFSGCHGESSAWLSAVIMHMQPVSLSRFFD